MRNTLKEYKKIGALLLLIFLVTAGQDIEAFTMPIHPLRERRWESVQTRLNHKKEEAVFEREKEHRIKDFPMIKQLPELPTGCEITAATMVLNYYGYPVDKIEMALEYLPRIDMIFQDIGGRVVGPDMKRYFVGNPEGEGMICGNIAVETAVNRYMDKVGGEYTARAIQGIDPEELYDYVAKDIPVVIWCTVNMEDREEPQGWYCEDGSYVEWSYNDHGAVLVGYNDEDAIVTIADPIYDFIGCSKERFERIFKERGSQCVILEKGTVSVKKEEKETEKKE